MDFSIQHFKRKTYDHDVATVPWCYQTHCFITANTIIPARWRGRQFSRHYYNLTLLQGKTLHISPRFSRWCGRSGGFHISPRFSRWRGRSGGFHISPRFSRWRGRSGGFHISPRFSRWRGRSGGFHVSPRFSRWCGRSGGFCFGVDGQAFRVGVDGQAIFASIVASLVACIFALAFALVCFALQDTMHELSKSE